MAVKEKLLGPIHVDQIELIGAIVKHLGKRHKVKHLLPRQYNAIIAGANLIVEQCAEGERQAGAGIGVQAWLLSDQTGVSSKYMLRALQGGEAFRRMWHAATGYGHPHDASDFGRCLGLLSAAPELRQHLELMSECGPEWSALVAHWEELECLHGTDPHKCSDRIRKIMKTIRETRPAGAR